MSDIKAGLWLNEKREKDTHPLLKAGKPVNINGQDYWLSAWVNAGKGNPEMDQAVIRMFNKLAEANDKYPIINLSLSPAESKRGTSAPKQQSIDDSIPF